MSELKEQAKEICKKHGITMKVGSPKYGPVDWDKEYDHYRFPVTLRKDGKSMRVMFTQSRAQGSTPPDEYDIITCITKYDPGSFEDFCSDFGYDTEPKRPTRPSRPNGKRCSACSGKANASMTSGKSYKLRA